MMKILSLSSTPVWRPRRASICGAYGLLAIGALAALGPVGDASAVTAEYDASSGQLPQDLGWAYADQAAPPATTAVAGGLLTLNSSVQNRARWDLDPVPGASGGEGAFMEATLRVVSEQHTRADRGVALPQLAHADGANQSSVDLYAHEDRIILNDSDDVTVGAHLMDTTDSPHTYRVELLRSRYWVFVDDVLVLDGVTPVSPSSLDGVAGGFGDSSAFSGGVTEWSSVRIGSLADIGGPTVPEPAGVLTVLLSSALLCAARRRA